MTQSVRATVFIALAAAAIVGGQKDAGTRRSGTKRDQRHIFIIGGPVIEGREEEPQERVEREGFNVFNSLFIESLRRDWHIEAVYGQGKADFASAPSIDNTWPMNSDGLRNLLDRFNNILEEANDSCQIMFVINAHGVLSGEGNERGMIEVSHSIMALDGTYSLDKLARFFPKLSESCRLALIDLSCNSGATQELLRKPVTDFEMRKTHLNTSRLCIVTQASSDYEAKNFSTFRGDFFEQALAERLGAGADNLRDAFFYALGKDKFNAPKLSALPDPPDQAFFPPLLKSYDLLAIGRTKEYLDRLVLCKQCRSVDYSVTLPREFNVAGVVSNIGADIRADLRQAANDVASCLSQYGQEFNKYRDYLTSRQSEFGITTLLKRPETESVHMALFEKAGECVGKRNKMNLLYWMGSGSPRPGARPLRETGTACVNFTLH